MPARTSEQIADLEAKIRHHQRLYYDLNEPEISDAEFDRLWDELKEAAPDSPVLSERSQFDADYKHEYPMGSLEKCKTIEEVVRRLGDKGEGDLKGMGTITAKLDGASLAVHYENGRLVRAVTRGRTETGKGKIVTANALMIRSIPKTIPYPGKMEVRGECVILNKDFAEMADKYANPRNAASGGLTCQSPQETADRKLTFVAYKVIGRTIGQGPSYEFRRAVNGDEDAPDEIVGKLIDTQPLGQLVEWGFMVPRAMQVDLSQVEAVRKAIEDWLRNRDTLPYWNDGIVIRINDDEAYNALGLSGVCPNGACAYKFETEEKETTVLDIFRQTGRTGRLTPVARIEPTQLGGSIIEFATLHNEDHIEQIGVEIGDSVILVKAGEIIPQIKRVTRKCTPCH